MKYGLEQIPYLSPMLLSWHAASILWYLSSHLALHVGGSVHTSAQRSNKWWHHTSIYIHLQLFSESRRAKHFSYKRKQSWNKKSVMYYWYMKKKFTTLFLDVADLLWRVQSGASQAFVQDWTRWGNGPKLSLNNGFFSAFFYTPAIVMTVQLAESMWGGRIYRRGGGGLGSK